MRCDSILIFISVNLVLGENINLHSRNNENQNSLACPGNKICTPVDYCSDMMSLMNEATLPIHRFRQAICGYIGKNPKVCCNIPSDIGNFNSRNNPRPAEHIEECGKSFVISNILTLGSYPFLARIGFINLNDGNIKYSCSGTIINKRTILTTATCALATANNYKLHSVLIGEYNTADNPDCNELLCAYCTRSYNISYIVKYPKFQRESYHHNIALIRLNESISFTLTAQSICYSDREYSTVGSVSMLVGWGKLSRTQVSTEQQALRMNILNEQQCGEFINRGLSVELCAIGPDEPCSGFSGSPLVHYDHRRRYTLVGMLSYGSSCNINDNSPSVFVDIQKYFIWISENS